MKYPGYIINTWLLVLSVVMLSLPILRLADYGITLSLVALCVYIIKIGKVSYKSLITLFFLLAFFILNALAYITNLDAYEFLKSFALTTVFFLCYCLSFGAERTIINFINIRIFLWATTVIIVGYEAAQVLELLVIGTTKSWFFLENYSISTATEIGRFEAVNLIGYYRPISVYHEPSYLGIVLFALLVVNNNTINVKFLSLILVVAIFFTLSMVAMIFTLIYLYFIFLKSYRNFAVVVVICFFPVVCFVWFDDVVAIFRLNEIMAEGTSGWVRLMLPFEETVSIVTDRYFGNPLGQNEVIFDNSFFLFFVYFGVALPFVMMIWLAALGRSVGFNTNFARYLTFFFGLIFLNGAIFTPESTLILLIVSSSFFANGRDGTRRLILPVAKI